MQEVPEPLSEMKLYDLIHAAEGRMTPQQQRAFDIIRITPERWRQTPYGDARGGFWTVGLIGCTVIWYNEIEQDFNTSPYRVYGEIDGYWCIHENLELALQHILNGFESTFPFEPSYCKASPPKPGPFPGARSTPR